MISLLSSGKLWKILHKLFLEKIKFDTETWDIEDNVNAADYVVYYVYYVVVRQSAQVKLWLRGKCSLARSRS